MNYSRLRGGLNAARTAYHRAGDAIARHPYLVRTVVVGTSLVGGLINGTIGGEAHGDDGVLDTFTDYIQNVQHSAGPDGISWTGDDSAIVDLKDRSWSIEFRAEDVGHEKIREITSFSRGDYVTGSVHKHLVKNNIVLPDEFAYHGINMERVEPQQDKSGEVCLGSLGALAAVVLSLFTAKAISNWYSRRRERRCEKP